MRQADGLFVLDINGGDGELLVALVFAGQDHGFAFRGDLKILGDLGETRILSQALRDAGGLLLGGHAIEVLAVFQSDRSRVGAGGGNAVSIDGRCFLNTNIRGFCVK